VNMTDFGRMAQGRRSDDLGQAEGEPGTSPGGGCRRRGGRARGWRVRETEITVTILTAVDSTIENQSFRCFTKALRQ
jgi:hypothetical protein